MRHPTNEPDDETAVRLALAGERRMFALLLGRHRGSVLGLCRRLLGSEADAQDAAQEAALQAFLGLRRLREPGRFGAWLHSIAANLARSALRRRHPLSLEAFREGTQDITPLVDASPTPEEVRLARELHDEVLAALEGLSAVNREAVVGYYLRGYGQAELAELLGVPVSTVKGRLHKGRRALAPSLGPVASQVLGKGRDHEEAAMSANTERDGMVEMVVGEVVKTGFDGERHLRMLREAGNMDELLEVAARDHGGLLPAAAVVLREARGERVLPIWMSLWDGASIRGSAAGSAPTRPMTHDLMGQMLDALGLGVSSVAVLRLAEGVFYGEISLNGAGQGDEGTRRVDARPSDAIALAVRLEAPIYAAEAVLEEGGYPSRGALAEAKGEDFGPR